MLKRRFLAYIVGACIVAFLFVSYISYRAYQNHVEFKAFMSNTQSFNRSIKGHHVHSSKDHVHHAEGLSVASKPDQIGETGQVEFGQVHTYNLTPDGEYVYEIGGFPHYYDGPQPQEVIELHEWIATGKMTPAVEVQLKFREMLREQEKHNVAQHVVTPDGILHQVIVPRHSQYEEGDAILKSELDPPILREEVQNPKRGGDKLIIEGVEYPIPDEFQAIADPYEREEYTNKFAASLELGISMAEVEKKVAKGELDFSLSEDAKRHVDEWLAMVERSKMTWPEIPPLSDKPPVKVRFLPDDGENVRPGWMQKQKLQALNVEQSILTGGEIFDEESTNEDASGASVRSDIPPAPSDLPGMVESPPSRPSEAGGEASNRTPTPPTTKSVETELREQLSPERFDKAQQLIDQYGGEEGLRRLREMDPDAARQFEREQREREMNTEP